MNKVILGLILAVCILGMALVMLNETWQKNDYSPPPMAGSGFHRIPVWCRKSGYFNTNRNLRNPRVRLRKNVIARETGTGQARPCPLLVQEAAPWRTG